jgi:hypothetical protein
MGFALTKFAYAASALAEIIIAVTIIVLLAATTIPALFLRGKHKKSTAMIRNDFRLRDSTMGRYAA